MSVTKSVFAMFLSMCAACTVAIVFVDFSSDAEAVTDLSDLVPKLTRGKLPALDEIHEPLIAPKPVHYTAEPVRFWTVIYGVNYNSRTRCPCYSQKTWHTFEEPEFHDGFVSFTPTDKASERVTLSGGDIQILQRHEKLKVGGTVHVRGTHRH